MRVQSDVLDCMHLDAGYALMSVQNIMTCIEYFKLLDIHLNGSLNDLLFWTFIRTVTNMTRTECDRVFKLLDLDLSGEIEFEEFYFFFCIILASKDRFEKEFIFRHSDNIFNMLDFDGSGVITEQDFKQMGVLFNFDEYTIDDIFKEFELTGNKLLDLGEFRLFTMACIDQERERNQLIRIDAIERNEMKVVKKMKPMLMTAIKTNELPRPHKVERLLRHFERPRLPLRMHWYERLRPSYILFKHKRLRRCVDCIQRAIDCFWDSLAFLFRMLVSIPRCVRRCFESKNTEQDRRKEQETGESKLTDYKNFNRNRRRGLLTPKVVVNSKRSFFRWRWGRRSRKVTPAKKVSRAATESQSKSQVHIQSAESDADFEVRGVLGRELKEAYH